MSDYPTCICQECGNEWLYRGKYADQPDRIKCPIKTCRASNPKVEFPETLDTSDNSAILQKSDTQDITFTIDGVGDMLEPSAYTPPEDLKRIMDTERKTQEPETEPAKTEGKPSGAFMTDGFSTLIEFLGARLNLVFETSDFTVDKMSSQILGQAITEELAQSGGIETAVVSAYSRRLIIIAMVVLIFALPLISRIMPFVSKLLNKQKKPKEVVAEAEEVKISDATKEATNIESMDTIPEVNLDDIIGNR